MSKTRLNALTKKYSGKFGDQFVLRNRYGESLMVPISEKTKSGPTQNQVNVRRKFLLATKYAKFAIQDPDLLAAYSAKAEGNMSPYILAVTDYLNPPFILGINASAYKGNAGDAISVEAGDGFALVKVTVKILDADNNVIEEGECVENMKTALYDYTATISVDDPAGMTIVATATDNPGHSTEFSLTL